MKKVYTLFSLVAFCACFLAGISTKVSAQAALQIKPSQNTPSRNVNPLNRKMPPTPQSSATIAPQYLFLNDGWANDSALGGGVSTENAFFPLFPDTLGVFKFSSSFTIQTPTYLVGNVLDPLAPNMQYWAGSDWNKFTDYDVDSLLIRYVYNRHTASLTPDTVVIYLYSDTSAGVFTNWFSRFPGRGQFEALFGVTDSVHDSIQWKQMLYDHNGNQPLTFPGTMDIIKVPIDTSDTAFIGKWVAPHTPYHVPAGHLAITAMGFIPGYAHTATDTINLIKNDFSPIFFQMNGDGPSPSFPGTYPTFWGTGGQTDWNLTQRITKDERYNVSGNSWNGEFLPPYLFGQAFVEEELDIWYLVSTTHDVGIKESIAASGMKLYQNQPNPANHTTLIKYDLKNAGAVAMEITDLTGRVVSTMSQGLQTPGVHSVTLDVSKMAKGVYMYTLRTSGESLTRRMVVTE